MKKVYMICDKEEYVLYGIVKTEDRKKAMYECWKNWSKDTGLDLFEFAKSMTCYRYPKLDDLDFYYFDGRDASEEYERASPEILRKEITNGNNK